MAGWPTAPEVLRRLAAHVGANEESVHARFQSLLSARQGLTLVHFSAQPERYLTRYTRYTPKHPSTPPKHPQNNPKTIPQCTPYPTECA